MKIEQENVAGAIEEKQQGEGEPRKARLIAFYLPQFHPIPENDEWWGKGFTEWTNVTKAKPLFPGHHQPNLPADLGFYDLRVPEVRLAQAELAQKHGIEGFCYWHYWFGDGKRLLEKPFEEVLKSGQPNFPFCLGWANQTWTGIWHGCPNRILIEQTYPGIADYKIHFYSLVPAFTDERYITINGKPVFVVYYPQGLPDSKEFTDCWRELALKVGLPGIYFIGIADESWHPELHGFDAKTLHFPQTLIQRLPLRFIDKVCHKIWKTDFRKVLKDLFSIPITYDYRHIVQCDTPQTSSQPNLFPCVIPNWDNTPRSGRNGLVFKNSTPELFRVHLRKAITQVSTQEPEKQLIFVKSWNEWAEGNYLEPDQKFGTSYLEVIKSEILFSSSLLLNQSG